MPQWQYIPYAPIIYRKGKNVTYYFIDEKAYKGNQLDATKCSSPFSSKAQGLALHHKSTFIRATRC